jgi:hypothetical protein
MKLHLAIVSLLAMAPPPPPSLPNDVFLQVGEEGARGFAVARGSECLIITVGHLVSSPGTSLVMVVGARMQSGSAQVVQSFTDDIAILRVEGKTALCEKFEGIDTSDLDTVFETASQGLLRGRTESGEQSQVPVFLTKVSARYVSVSPVQPQQRLSEGMSGSLLVVDGRPAGILQLVETANNRGTVYRLDRVAQTVSSFVDLRKTAEVSPLQAFVGKWRSEGTDQTGQFKSVLDLELTQLDERNSTLRGKGVGTATEPSGRLLCRFEHTAIVRYLTTQKRFELEMIPVSASPDACDAGDAQKHFIRQVSSDQWTIELGAGTPPGVPIPTMKRVR